MGNSADKVSAENQELCIQYGLFPYGNGDSIRPLLKLGFVFSSIRPDDTFLFTDGIKQYSLHNWKFNSLRFLSKVHIPPGFRIERREGFYQITNNKIFIVVVINITPKNSAGAFILVDLRDDIPNIVKIMKGQL